MKETGSRPRLLYIVLLKRQTYHYVYLLKSTDQMLLTYVQHLPLLLAVGITLQHTSNKCDQIKC